MLVQANLAAEGCSGANVCQEIQPVIAGKDISTEYIVQLNHVVEIEPTINFPSIFFTDYKVVLLKKYKEATEDCK